MDNLKLGYGGTKTEMERLISDASKLDKTIKAGDMSFANIVKSIHAVQTQMGITGTTAKEASSTIQGSWNMLSASWENLLTGMTDPSQDFDALIQNVFDSIETFADNLMPRMSVVLDGITGLVEKLGPMLVQILSQLVSQLLPVIIDGTGQLINAAIGTIGTFAPGLANALSGLLSAFQLFAPVIVVATGAIVGYQAAVGLATTATTLFSAATTLLTNPIGLVGAAIGLAVAGFVGIKAAGEKARHEFYNMGDSLDELSNKYTTAKKSADLTEEYAAKWDELNEAISGGTLSGDELAQAEAERQEIEQWFIDNYGEYISAEEEKDGIRKETIGLITEQVELLSEQQRLELENQAFETKRKIPDLTKSIGELQAQNKELETQQTNLLTTNNALSKAALAWEGLTKEQKNSGEYQDVYNQMLADASAASGQSIISYQQLRDIIKLNNKEYEDNKEKIAENTAEIEDGQASIQSYADSCRQLTEIELGSSLEEFSNKMNLVKTAQEELSKTGKLSTETYDSLVQMFPDMAEGLSDSGTASQTLSEKMAELDEKLANAKAKANEFETELNGLPKDLTIDVKLNLPEIPQFASGTRGAKKGLAVVNDGTGPELIQSKSGAFRMIDSSGAVLTMLDDGDRVYTAEQTRAMLRGIPHYANGVGNNGMKFVSVTITSYMDKLPEKFEKAYKQLQLQRDLDVIDDAQYYLELEKLRDEYLTEGSDKWWEYTREIYDHQQEIFEEARDKEFDDLKEALNNNFITEKEYYDRLEVLRNKYFDEGSDGWQKYTEEIADYHVSQLKEMTKSALAAIDELQDKQDAFREKLESNFALTSTDDKGLTTLADLSVHVKGMAEYNANLDKLKGIVPESLYEQIREMSTQEGGSFMYAFFAASEAEQQKFIDEYTQIYGDAARYSKEAYADEFEGVADQVMDEFSKTPEEFFRLGEDSMEQFGQGFMENLSALMGRIQSTISTALSQIMPESISIGSSSNSYTDNSQITIIAGSVSEHELIEQYEQQRIYEQQVRGW